MVNTYRAPVAQIFKDLSYTPLFILAMHPISLLQDLLIPLNKLCYLYQIGHKNNQPLVSVT